MSDEKESLAAINALIDEGSAKRLKTLLAMVPVDGDDGLGIASARLDGSHLILGLSDDTEIDVGQVVMPQLPPIEGDPGISIRKVAVVDGELLFTLSNGESHNLGTPWRHGDDGRGIASVALQDGDLVIGFTDGESDVIGQVEGTDGEDGLGIDPEATRIQDGDLVIGFDDATDKQLKELTVEYKREKIRKSDRKRIGFEWHRPSGSNNEGWDLYGYCWAGLDMCAWDICINQSELESVNYEAFWQYIRESNGLYYVDP